MTKKSFLKSKTLWVALAQALLISFTPLAQKFVESNPSLFSGLVCFVFVFLRLITKEGISK